MTRSIRINTPVERFTLAAVLDPQSVSRTVIETEAQHEGKWTLVLQDGSRHEVTAVVRFQIIGGKKVPTGTIDGDPFIMHRAFREGPAILESSSSEQHAIAVTGAGSDWTSRRASGHTANTLKNKYKFPYL